MANLTGGLSILIILSLSIGSSGATDWNIMNNFGLRFGESDSLKKYCESWRVNVEINNIRWFTAVPQECVGHIKSYMTSLQYNADSQKALEEVKLYLNSRCDDVKEDGKDAWIFDIDDTLLSTIPYYQNHGFGGEELNKASFELWVRKSQAPALKLTLEVYNEIRDKGLKIFIISSRRECLRSPTVYNLLDAGYHGWASLSLRSPKDELVEIKTYKAAERQKLVNQGYRIWGIVGDQWSSFEEPPSAKRTFKLPNSMYYSWR